MTLGIRAWHSCPQPASRPAGPAGKRVRRLFGTLRRTVREVDASVPIYGIRTVDKQVDTSLTTERLLATLSTVFGALASC